jgi:hypothetical protein
MIVKGFLPQSGKKFETIDDNGVQSGFSRELEAPAGLHGGSDGGASPQGGMDCDVSQLSLWRGRRARIWLPAPPSATP